MSPLKQYIKTIKWEEKYSVGISIIDEEHKAPIYIMNAAIVAKQNGNKIDEISKLLRELMAYALTSTLQPKGLTW